MFKESSKMIFESFRQALYYDMLTEEELEVIYSVLKQSMERHMEGNN